jgi:hypothetical protein
MDRTSKGGLPVTIVTQIRIIKKDDPSPFLIAEEGVNHLNVVFVALESKAEIRFYFLQVLRELAQGYGQGFVIMSSNRVASIKIKFLLT